MSISGIESCKSVLHMMGVIHSRQVQVDEEDEELYQAIKDATKNLRDRYCRICNKYSRIRIKKSISPKKVKPPVSKSRFTDTTSYDIRECGDK
jgi:ribosome-associated translation inhibitor RaiA